MHYEVTNLVVSSDDVVLNEVRVVQAADQQSTFDQIFLSILKHITQLSDFVVNILDHVILIL